MGAKARQAKGKARLGAYEKLRGRIYFEVDPANSANRIITDIEHAPRNARGRVEFSSDFFLIKRLSGQGHAREEQKQQQG